MNFKAFAAIVLCTFSLAACKPNLKTIGTVDDDKLITPKILADMGYDAFREKYLGQEVTVTDFYHIYTNHFPDFVINDFLKAYETFDPQYLSYDQEVTLPAEICDEWCEYDQKTKACFYKSPDLKITGKAFFISGDDSFKTNLIYLKVKGVEY
ncbi:MAG: hypothetical protein P8X79_23195 [Reinekea sp.]